MRHYFLTVSWMIVGKSKPEILISKTSAAVKVASLIWDQNAN
jgi:hypothetical protein